MPNGHGGIPWLGAPAIIFLLTALFIWWARSTSQLLPEALSLIGAGFFGWRFAFHLTMWAASDYDGHYTSQDHLQVAKRKYCIAVIVFVPLSTLVTYWMIR